MENYESRLDAAFQALAHPTRRAVLRRLMPGQATVTDLAQPFDLGLPTFLKHLKVLERSGLISTEKVGRVRTCQAKPRQLKLVETWLSEQRAVWEARTERLADYVENMETLKNDPE